MGDRKDYWVSEGAYVVKKCREKMELKIRDEERAFSLAELWWLGEGFRAARFVIGGSTENESRRQQSRKSMGIWIRCEYICSF